MKNLTLTLALTLAGFLPHIATATAPETQEMRTDVFYQILDNTQIEYFSNRGILARDGEGTLHLESNITRAEFVVAVVEHAYPRWAISEECLQGLDTDQFPGVSYTHLFTDVNKDASYALHLCAAMRGGMIWGYSSGDFRPNKNINLAEAAKVMNIAFNLDYTMPMYQTDDWYKTYLRSLHKYTTFPETVTTPQHTMRVGEVRFMLENISKRTASYHGARSDGRLDPMLISTTRVQLVSTNAAQHVEVYPHLSTPHVQSRY